MTPERAAVKDMPPEQAVEYLLHLIEEYRRGTTTGAVAVVNALIADGGRITKTPALIFARLWERRGTVVEYGDLLDMLDIDRADGGASLYALTSAVKHLRKAVSHWPVEIIAHKKMGYRLTVTEPGWSPPFA